MNWIRDLPGEGKMKQLGVEWSVVKEGVPLCEINMELSLKQQARKGKQVNEDWVIEMAQAAQNGSEFPMPILQKEKGHYLIHSGIHRVSMAELIGEQTIPCYTVRIFDQRMLDIFPRAINTVNGHPESREALLAHARFICERHGYTAEQGAKWLGLRTEWVAVALRAGQVESKLNEIGIKADLPKTTLLALSPLANNNNVLKAVVKLLRDEDLAGDRARQVIDDAKKGETEHQQLAEIVRWRKLLEGAKPAAKKNGGPPPTPRKNRGTFIGLLTRFQKFIGGIETSSQLQLDDQDTLVALKSWEEIEHKMGALMNGHSLKAGGVR